MAYIPEQFFQGLCIHTPGGKPKWQDKDHKKLVCCMGLDWALAWRRLELCCLGPVFFLFFSYRENLETLPFPPSAGAAQYLYPAGGGIWMGTVPFYGLFQCGNCGQGHVWTQRQCPDKSGNHYIFSESLFFAADQCCGLYSVCGCSAGSVSI